MNDKSKDLEGIISDINNKNVVSNDNNTPTGDAPTGDTPTGDTPTGDNAPTGDNTTDVNTTDVNTTDVNSTETSDEPSITSSSIFSTEPITNGESLFGEQPPVRTGGIFSAKPPSSTGGIFSAEPPRNTINGVSSNADKKTPPEKPTRPEPPSKPEPPINPNSKIKLFDSEQIKSTDDKKSTTSNAPKIQVVSIKSASTEPIELNGGIDVKKLLPKITGEDEAKPLEEQDIKNVGVARNPHIKKLREKNKRGKRTKKQKNLALIGFVVTIVFVVGLVTTVRESINITVNLINQTSQKNLMAKEILPLVIVDAPTFNDPKNLDPSVVISAGIWEFVINEEDKSKYATDQLGSMFVPAVDIEYHIKRLFGNDVEIVHQSIEDSSIMMMYNHISNTYSIESTPLYLTYTPRIDTITRNGDYYRLEVSYLLPDAISQIIGDDYEERVGKNMVYTVYKTSNNIQMVSVEFTQAGDGYNNYNDNTEMYSQSSTSQGTEFAMNDNIQTNSDQEDTDFDFTEDIAL